MGCILPDISKTLDDKQGLRPRIPRREPFKLVWLRTFNFDHTIPRFIHKISPFTMSFSRIVVYADAVLFDMVCLRILTRALFVLN